MRSWITTAIFLVLLTENEGRGKTGERCGNTGTDTEKIIIAMKPSSKKEKIKKWKSSQLRSDLRMKTSKTFPQHIDRFFHAIPFLSEGVKTICQPPTAIIQKALLSSQYTVPSSNHCSSTDFSFMFSIQFTPGDLDSWDCRELFYARYKKIRCPSSDPAECPCKVNVSHTGKLCTLTADCTQALRKYSILAYWCSGSSTSIIEVVKWGIMSPNIIKLENVRFKQLYFNCDNRIETQCSNYTHGDENLSCNDDTRNFVLPCKCMGSRVTRDNQVRQSSSPLHLTSWLDSPQHYTDTIVSDFQTGSRSLALVIMSKTVPVTWATGNDRGEREGDPVFTEEEYVDAIVDTLNKVVCTDCESEDCYD